ncbi:MAG: hypothetical protein LH606_06590 [Cytophagaceae bacterium]|nr:hypothetical protein [Cytophagaceae bacterium]
MRTLLVGNLMMALLSANLDALSQDCKNYYFMNKGAEVEMTVYDRKGEVDGRNVYKVNEVKNSSNRTEANVSTVSYNNKGKEQMSTGNMTVICEGGMYSADLRNLVSPEMMGGMKGMDVRVTGNMAEYPSSLQPGMALKDANMTAEPTTEGMALMRLSVSLKNRKVEGKESITSPAGTFDCYKITYDASVKTIIGINFQATEWFAPGFGVVKTESSRNGKLMGSTLITKVSKAQ